MSEQGKGMLLAGDLLVSILGAGNVWGSWFNVECDELSIATPAEMVRAISRRRGAAYGQPHTSVPVAQPSTFSARFTQVTREIMAMRLSGALESVVVAGGVFTDVDVTLPADDGWVEIGRDGLSGTTVVKNSAGAVTYDAGKDYELNPRLGMIRRIATGALAASATVKVSGTEAAGTIGRIEGGSQRRTILRIKLDGEDLVTRRDCRLAANRVVVMSTEAHNFLQAEIATAPLTGDLEIPADGGAPFTFTYL